MNDIDLSGINWDPIGDYEPSSSDDFSSGFSGILDGNGHIIKNLTIDYNANKGNTEGLFGLVYMGEINNLGLEHISFSGEFEEIDEYYGEFGMNLIGGLVGWNAGGTISNCCVQGNISLSMSQIISQDDTTYRYSEGVGGLAGINQGIIENSYSSCNISVEDINQITDDRENLIVSNIGGLAGRQNAGTLSNCYATGIINLKNIVGILGGLVGDNEVGEIVNCYTTVSITTNGLEQDYYLLGGILGTADGYDDTIISNSFFDNEKTGTDEIMTDIKNEILTNNSGLTTKEMQNVLHFINAGWDAGIWDFSTSPPTLKNMPNIINSSNPSIQPGGDGTEGTDPDDPNTPGGGTGGAWDVPIPGAVRLQIGSNSLATSAIYVDTSFDLGTFDIDFSSADSCAAAIDDIDEVLSRINTKRSEFGAAINRLNSILESQTTTIQNYTAAKSTIMDSDIATESADYVKNQILQQTSSALLAQSQNPHASIVLSLIG